MVPHFVTALTGHPAAADPFAYGWRRQARLFTATDDAEVERILRVHIAHHAQGFPSDRADGSPSG